MKTAEPVVRDVVLLGGGHTHVIVIRKWAMKPITGVRLTLVSLDALTPYSGMLPGLVAGHYTVEQSHIDLTRLCRWAGVRFIEDEATGIDPENNQIVFGQRPALGYDIISIDTGGAPRLDNVKGAATYTVPVKPVHQFYDHWRKIEASAAARSQGLNIGVVGAGAGGFEILLAMQQKISGVAGKNKTGRHQFHWMIRGQVLAGYPKWVQSAALDVCKKRGITCHHDFNVVEVNSEGVQGANGEHLQLDEVLWCTEAMASKWPAASGLQCDKSGFIEVNDSLQSLSHPNVFAAGDVAIQINHPRPRAGVFAVRQGPVLFSNLQRVVTNRTLETYRPQRKFLTLLSIGAKSAIGNKGPFSVKGKWVWKWKNWIDLRFMDRFNRLPAMPEIELEKMSPEFTRALQSGATDYRMRCGGCGAKVPWDIVTDMLSGLNVHQHADQETGISERGDVALINPTGPLLAQSVDQVRGFIEDPWVFARIAAVHALSDLYAVNADPQSAMLLVNLPYMHDAILRRDLQQLLAGVVYELNQAGCELSGGHSSESAELSLGLVVNGNLKQTREKNTGDALYGYKLVITKPLGVGVIMAADMRAESKGKWVQEAVRLMLLSNSKAAKILERYHVAGTTDITGFGLIGHLCDLLKNLDAGCELNLEQIPLLTGALELSDRGVRSSLYEANLRFSKEIDTNSDVDKSSVVPLLFDPQTSGGLLAVVPEDSTKRCLEHLRDAGYEQARVVGTLVKSVDSKHRISITHEK